MSANVTLLGPRISPLNHVCSTECLNPSRSLSGPHLWRHESIMPPSEAAPFSAGNPFTLVACHGQNPALVCPLGTFQHAVQQTRTAAWGTARQQAALWYQIGAPLQAAHFLGRRKVASQASALAR